MLSNQVIEEVLNRALQTGASFAEIFMEHRIDNSVQLVSGDVIKSLGGVSHGLGLRIFFNGFSIYGYTNDTSHKSLLKLATDVSLAVNGADRNIVLPFFNKDVANIHTIKHMPNSESKIKAVDYLKEVSDKQFKQSKFITETSGNYMDMISDVFIANSDGLITSDQRVRSRFVVNAVSSKENLKESSHFIKGGMVGFEIFDDVDTSLIAQKTATTAVNLLSAKPCPSGKMPVIIDNGFGGVIFHEACGHSLEATAIAKGASVFCDKLGEKIANSKVTAIDDGTLKNEWGSINIDDEGTDSKKNVLIENGILKGYLVDKLNGQKMGMESTGSSRRESYKYAPTSRMTNTFIANGTDKVEDIFNSVSDGLYAKKMGGGSVMPTTGEFNFSVLEGYLIKNGKITDMVKGATLIGKGHEVLLDIDYVSDTLSQESGMCGSISGSVPTNVGQPLLRVKELTVGGSM